MSDHYETIRLEQLNDTARIVLENPPANVLTTAMVAEIHSVLRSLRSNTPPILVLSAQGKHFSAGADVGEHLPDKVEKMLKSFHALIYELLDYPAPTIAALQGSALGGGCELALACDFVFATERAKIGQPEIHLGVFAPAGSVFIPRLCGTKAAMELLLTGDAVSAPRACDLGLINAVFSTEELDESIDKFVSRLSRHSLAALACAKRACLDGSNGSLKEALGGVEKYYLEELMRREDPVEGLKSFLEKRRPVWKHR